MFSRSQRRSSPADAFGHLTGLACSENGKSSRKTVMEHCIQSCTGNNMPNWYGKQPSCLPNSDRKWKDTKGANLSSIEQFSQHNCSCHEPAEASMRGLEFLHGAAFASVTILITLQVYVALALNAETFVWPQRFTCENEILLGLFLSAFLSICLILQQNEIDKCDTLIYRSMQETTRFEYSWAMLSISLLVVLMVTGVMPTVRWLLREHYGADVKEECDIFSSCDAVLRVYDSLFSYKNGQLFMVKGLVMKSSRCVHSFTSCIRSRERPWEWIAGVSSRLF